MADFTLREYEKGDLPALKEIWLACFDDFEAFIDGVHALLPRLGTAVTAVYGAQVCGGAYILEDMSLPTDEGAKRLALIYAVGVKKEFRRLGMGGALVREAVSLARARGADIVTILPARDSLYDWYKSTADFDCCLYRRERLVEAADMALVSRISREEYFARRRELLHALPAVEYGESASAMQELLLNTYFGGFYACAGAIAAGSTLSGELGVITELLCPKGMDEELFAAAVGFEMGVENVRLLSAGEKGQDKKYIACVGGALCADTYFPFAFD